jgi:transcriptional regulator of NAD metabolism
MLRVTASKLVEVQGTCIQVIVGNDILLKSRNFEICVKDSENYRFLVRSTSSGCHDVLLSSERDCIRNLL